MEPTVGLGCKISSKGYIHGDVIQRSIILTFTTSFPAVE